MSTYLLGVDIGTQGTKTCLYASDGRAAASAFADVTSGEYYEGAVNWAVEKGVTTGVSHTTNPPAGPCTRGQIVTFIYRWAAK